MKLFWRIAAVCAAILTGLGILSWLRLRDIAVAYGPPGPVKYGTPAVRLDVKALSVTPPSPVHVGDTLIFTAELEPLQYRSVNLQLHSPQYSIPLELALHDDGVSPDAVAKDNIYSGGVKWKEDYGTGKCAATLYAPGQKDGRPAFADAVVQFEVLP